MVTIEKNYTLCEGDKKLLFSVTTDLKKKIINEDAIINIERESDSNKCIELLQSICNNRSAVTIRFRDIYYLFSQSGKWKYEEFSFYTKDIQTLDLYNYYKKTKECFVIFVMGDGIDLFNMDDILENIRHDRDNVDITFGFLKDINLKPQEIHLSIYSR